MLDKTVIAQILTTLVAFAIFAWSLKKFIWTGISQAIEARQAHIESQFEDITNRQNELETQQAEYRKFLATMQEEGEKLKLEEIARGRELAAQIEAEAHSRVEGELAQAKQKVDIELAKAREMLRQEVVTLSITISERILRKQIDEATQDQLMSEFISQVKDLQKQAGSHK